MSSHKVNSRKMTDETPPGNRCPGAITEELDETELEHDCQTVIKAEQWQRKYSYSCSPLISLNLLQLAFRVQENP